MRRGLEAIEGRIGGACERAGMMGSGALIALNAAVAVETVPSAICECETSCETDVCTNGACIAGMVLQQSWLLCPCE